MNDQVFGGTVLYLLGAIAMYLIGETDLDMPWWVAGIFAAIWPLGLPILGALFLYVHLPRRHDG